MTVVLEVQRLSKTFNGVHALEDLDLEVREREILGLMGPNGSGKTTLFNCVTGFAQPTGGGVIWRIGRARLSVGADYVRRRSPLTLREYRRLQAGSSVAYGL